MKGHSDLLRRRGRTYLITLNCLTFKQSRKTKQISKLVGNIILDVGEAKLAIKR